MSYLTHLGPVQIVSFGLHQTELKNHVLICALKHYQCPLTTMKVAWCGSSARHMIFFKRKFEIL
jgi:hypothetical protein